VSSTYSTPRALVTTLPQPTNTNPSHSLHNFTTLSTFPVRFSVPPLVVTKVTPSPTIVLSQSRFTWQPPLPVVKSIQPLPQWSTVPAFSPPLTADQMSAILHPSHPKMYTGFRKLSATALDPPLLVPSMLPTRRFGFDQFGVPLAPNSTREEFDWNLMLTLFANVTAMVANSVCANSQSTYQTGWKRWITFTATIGTDRYLQYTPPMFQAVINQSIQAVQFSFAILACCSYLAYLVSHPTKPVSAPTANGYLSAVRYNLKKFGMDIAFMDSSCFLKAARQGIVNEWRLIPGNSLSDRRTLPVNIGMIEYAAAQTLNLQNLTDFTTYVACIFAYTILCRVSEYIKRPETNHHMLSQSVVFWVRHPNPADASALFPFLYIPSHQIHLYLKTQIAGVTVTVKDSKADPHGEGDKYPFPCFEGPWPTTMVYDFAHLMYDYAVRARPLVDQPFFSTSTAEPLKISADSMNKWLKDKLAPLFQLKKERIHTHSLRFAGASTLAAAGLPDSVIMKMGRWKSLAFLGYIRLAKEIFSRVAAALADRTTFSIADVRNLMPSA